MRHLTAVPAFLAACFWPQLACASRPPNIVLIMADDLGFETVGCYGGTSYHTPHLDRLAATGMRFSHAYATPLCTNTRVQLMTGKYNHRNWRAFGILDPREKTFGHYLQQAGYKTCIVGKWQLQSYDPPDYPGAAGRRASGMRPEEAGFDEYSLWHTGHTEAKGSRYADPVIEQNGRLLDGTHGKYGPDIWTDYLGDFMARHREEPFFVYYPMALPHNPMVPTPRSPAWKDPEARHREETRFAKDMIEYVDTIAGRIVAKLDESNAVCGRPGGFGRALGIRSFGKTTHDPARALLGQRQDRPHRVVPKRSSAAGAWRGNAAVRIQPLVSRRRAAVPALREP